MRNSRSWDAVGVGAGALLIAWMLWPAFRVSASGIMQSAYQLVQDEGVSVTRRNTLNFTGGGITCADSGGKTACDVPAAPAGGYATVQDDGSALTQRQTINFIGGGVTCVDNGGASKTDCTIPGATANQAIRAFGGSFDGGGSALTAGGVTYFTVPFACTISAWNITVDGGTATVDIWKIATGTAIPTNTNSITAAATPAISSGTAIHSTTLTGWTTSVAANDIVGIALEAVATATTVNLTVQCDAT